jgi:hypothetical protein
MRMDSPTSLLTVVLNGIGARGQRAAVFTIAVAPASRRAAICSAE